MEGSGRLQKRNEYEIRIRTRDEKRQQPVFVLWSFVFHIFKIIVIKSEPNSTLVALIIRCI